MSRGGQGHEAEIRETCAARGVRIVVTGARMHFIEIVLLRGVTSLPLLTLGFAPSVMQAYVGLIDYGLDIQEALEAPRFLSGRFGLGEARDTLHIEARFPSATLADLERRGHTLNRWGDWNELAGHAHGIIIDPDTGFRHGGSDPRSDGAAVGY